jgi:hypothetical protein
MVASKATLYAPLDASRKTLIEGIGRGIGRVAVHEFFHQILGAEAVDNDKDEHSYEYGSPDRQLSTMAYCTGRRGCRFCAGESARKA